MKCGWEMEWIKRPFPFDNAAQHRMHRTRAVTSPEAALSAPAHSPAQGG
jgi:hypothetical protein